MFLSETYGLRTRALTGYVYLKLQYIYIALVEVLWFMLAIRGVGFIKLKNSSRSFRVLLTYTCIIYQAVTIPLDVHVLV
jgi:hypothetical protein